MDGPVTLSTLLSFLVIWWAIAVPIALIAAAFMRAGSTPDSVFVWSALDEPESYLSGDEARRMRHARLRADSRIP
jgi:hypothetical protein